MVDVERLNRYAEKFSLAKERLQYITDWYDHPIDLKTRFAIYKAGQEAIEVIIDVIAMIRKDLDLVVKDDYSNIDKMVELELLSNSDASVLREANGLRNRLVHDYNGIDDDLALQSLMRLHPQLLQIIGDLKPWIEKELTD